MVSCAVYKPRVLTNHIQFACGHHVILLMKWLFSKCSFPMFSKLYLLHPEKGLSTIYSAMGSWLGPDGVFQRLRKFPSLLWPYTHPGLGPHRITCLVKACWVETGPEHSTHNTAHVSIEKSKLCITESLPPLLKELPHWTFRPPSILFLSAKFHQSKAPPFLLGLSAIFCCDKIHTFTILVIFKYIKYIHITITTTIHHQNFCQVST